MGHRDPSVVKVMPILPTFPRDGANDGGSHHRYEYSLLPFFESREIPLPSCSKGAKMASVSSPSSKLYLFDPDYLDLTFEMSS
jgi:hypothetical protein